MFYKCIQDTPRLVPVNYRELYNKQLLPDDEEEQDFCAMKYWGTGIKPEEHPLHSSISMSKCLNCNSLKVLVIYAQWSVSTHSGDLYWDYEIFCEDCKKYVSVSYNEND